MRSSLFNALRSAFESGGAAGGRYAVHGVHFASTPAYRVVFETRHSGYTQYLGHIITSAEAIVSVMITILLLSCAIRRQTLVKRRPLRVHRLRLIYDSVLLIARSVSLVAFFYALSQTGTHFVCNHDLFTAQGVLLRETLLAIHSLSVLSLLDCWFSSADCEFDSYAAVCMRVYSRSIPIAFSAFLLSEEYTGDIFLYFIILSVCQVMESIGFLSIVFTGGNYIVRLGGLAARLLGYIAMVVQSAYSIERGHHCGTHISVKWVSLVYATLGVYQYLNRALRELTIAKTAGKERAERRERHRAAAQRSKEKSTVV